MWKIARRAAVPVPRRGGRHVVGVWGRSADVTGRPRCDAPGALAAAGGAVASVVFLVHDLGRPERFLHMLRVFKPTSPLSVGTYILSPFSAAAGATAASELHGLVPRAVEALRWAVAAVFGPAAGHLHRRAAGRTPPCRRGTRRTASCRSCSPARRGRRRRRWGCVGASVRDNVPAARLAVAGAVVELAAGEYMERKLGLLGDVYQKGRAHTLMRASKACLAAGAVGAVLGRRRRWSAALSGLALMAGSALTRFGVFDAGIASANDPAHIVVPQRERIRQRQATTGTDVAPPDRTFA